MEETNGPRNLVPMSQEELTLACDALDFLRMHGNGDIDACEDLRAKLDSWREED